MGSVHRLVGKMGSFLLRFGKNTQFVTEQIESDATENDGGLNLVMSHPCQNLYLYFTYFTNHPVNATKNWQPFEVLLVAAGGGGTTDLNYSTAPQNGTHGIGDSLYSPTNYQTPNATTFNGSTSTSQGTGGSIQQYIANNAIGNVYTRSNTMRAGYGGGAVADDTQSSGGGWYCNTTQAYSRSAGTKTTGMTGANDEGGSVLITPAVSADGEISDAKIGNRTLIDEAASSTLIPIAAKQLTAWLQGIRNNLKALFEGKANDADVVKLTGNQTIGGTKTFSTSPVVSSKTTAAGTAGTAIATEAQVNLKANRASPTFTGTVSVPSKTTAATNSGTLVATEAQVKSVADSVSAAYQKPTTGIPAGDIADGAITDEKIGNRTLVDNAANATLVSIAAKSLTAWLQGIRDNLKSLFQDKAANNHASTATTYGVATQTAFGHSKFWVSSCLQLKWWIFIDFSADHLGVCYRIDLNGLLEQTIK